MGDMLKENPLQRIIFSNGDHQTRNYGKEETQFEFDTSRLPSWGPGPHEGLLVSRTER